MAYRIRIGIFLKTVRSIVGARLVHISTNGPAMPLYLGVIHMFTWLSTEVDKMGRGDACIASTTG
jgi:hypothetical protein